ncbi:IS1 family transposase [Coleofasciculus sp. FACHB-64]|uniref:transposase n=1 Tax=Cyanophyceae TaxID=3028117 RepID=UPI0016827E12|nr:IS1 family transposase [Coleofasciculus sp. FACHB-501]MBD1892309.1 IS1 family transposase [Coleofasciculus sp. FACHB-SPT9]MBD2046850.1 IS1 family transposase [Coleofasciculus sp. FACHB-64]
MRRNHEDCIALLEQIRWSGKPKCPYCESTNYRKLKNEHRYQCNECFTSYSVTVGTLFHKTHVDLDKWILAIPLVLKSPAGISGRQLAKEIGVNKNTACYMIERIRRAITEEPELLQKLSVV